MSKRFDFKSAILFEDDDYYIINKPAGLSVLEDRAEGAENKDVLSIAKRYSPDVQVAHRIDKDTSGVLILAKNNNAYKHASAQFQNRKVEKLYHAISGGYHNFDNALVDLDIKTSARGKTTISNDGGKSSQTYFKTLENYRNFTLVECKPITGRLHQIRVHLLSQNATIAHDKVYRGEIPYLSDFKKKYSTNRTGMELPMIKRMALHAYSISFKNSAGKEVSATAEYPKDFKVFVKLLKKFNK